MARTYAGILGSLALVVALWRGTLAGAGVEATLGQGIVALAVFALIGGACGGLANWIVREAVYAQLQEELAAKDTKPSGKPEAANRQ